MPDTSVPQLALLSNSLVDWSIACAVATAALTILLLLRRSVRAYLTRAQSTVQVELLELPAQVLSRTAPLLLVIIALVIGSQSLTIGSRTQQLLASAITITLFWQAGIWAVTAVSIWLARGKSQHSTADRAASSSLGIIGFVLNVFIWAIVALLTLDNLGVDITALIAGLGIGGIAVALAVQNVLGDIFACLSITLDRPFVIGDFLIIGDVMGSVEYIGIKSTRLRSLSGEQIIMSNSDVLGSRVRNFGRMTERRVEFGTSITYETSIGLIERLPEVIRKIIEDQEDTRFDRSHFAKHAAASLDFETVYFVLSADYNRFMDIQQSINLRLHKELLSLGGEFAYPTQRLYVVPRSDAVAGRGDGAAVVSQVANGKCADIASECGVGRQ